MDATRRGFLAAAGTTGAYNLAQAQDHDQSHGHSHDHSHQAVPSDLTLRVKALESLLVEKGLVDRAALDALVDTYEHKVGPRNGARVVAKAWADPAYKQRLLTDSTAAIAELGYGGQQGGYGGGFGGNRGGPRNPGNSTVVLSQDDKNAKKGSIGTFAGKKMTF